MSKQSGWTSGEAVILYAKYEELKQLIGEENYLTTEGLSSEETAQIILRELQQTK